MFSKILLICLSAVIPSRDTVVIVTVAAITILEVLLAFLAACLVEKKQNMEKHFSDIIRI